MQDKDKEASAVYRSRVVEGLFNKYTGNRDLTIAAITRNLEYPGSSNIEELEAAIEKLAHYNEIISLLQHMFGDTENAKEGCCDAEETSD